MTGVQTCALPIFNIDTTPSNSTNYKQNKIDSIAFSIHLLQNNYKNDNLLSIINSHKKKDDLCDAYLQGFRYLFITGGIPKLYQDKLQSIAQDKLTVGEIKKTKRKTKTKKIVNEEINEEKNK